MATGRRHRSAFAIVLLLGAMLVSISGASAQQASPVIGTPRAVEPIAFPRDDGPHDVPIEWWYYTGHLFTEAGDRYGFEYVVFKAERRGILGYASHFAITDNPRGAFAYDQRAALAPPDANTPGERGFDIAVGDWTMAGANGDDRLVADLPGYAIDLRLSGEKPPVLHEGDGYIDYGSGSYTYYYSRTRIAIEGTLVVDGVPLAVTGEAWFDHQWGDFFSVIASGWDWYALQLDDGSEVMLYVVRGLEGGGTRLDGSLVAADGTATVLTGDDFAIEATGTWTSPTTGGTYPSGWRITIPDKEIELTLTPTLPDQELDTTETTGVIYWEGEVTVDGTRDGTPLEGLGYVELTGYATAG